MNISIIVARSTNNVIGKDNTLPWKLSKDLKRFKELTFGHHMIMGRKTFESIGKSLPGRISIVVTRNKNFKADGCIIVHSLEDAFNKAQSDKQPFIIGGTEIFKQALPFTNTVYLTELHKEFEGDAFFKYKFKTDEWDIEENISHNKNNEFDYSFITYKRIVPT